VSDQSSVDPKTKPIVAGFNAWTHALLATLKLDHLNVVSLQLTLEPNKIATLSATIAMDVDQADGLRQALEHKHYALLELDTTPPPPPAAAAPAAAPKPRRRRTPVPAAA